MAQKPHRPKVLKPDPQVIAAEVERTRLRTQVGKTAIIAAAVPISVLALWPVALAVAGKNTVVNVVFTVTLTIALAVTGLGLAAWVRHEKRRADNAESRVRKLEAKNLAKDDQRSLRGYDEGEVVDLPT